MQATSVIVRQSEKKVMAKRGVTAPVGVGVREGGVGEGGGMCLPAPSGCVARGQWGIVRISIACADILLIAVGISAR
jgi:hypothetical protein